MSYLPSSPLLPKSGFFFSSRSIIIHYGILTTTATPLVRNLHVFTRSLTAVTNPIYSTRSFFFFLPLRIRKYFACLAYFRIFPNLSPSKLYRKPVDFGLGVNADRYFLIGTVSGRVFVYYCLSRNAQTCRIFGRFKFFREHFFWKDGFTTKKKKNEFESSTQNLLILQFDIKCFMSLKRAIELYSLYD